MCICKCIHKGRSSGGLAGWYYSQHWLPTHTGAKVGGGSKPDDFMPNLVRSRRNKTEEEIQMNAQLLGQRSAGKMGKLSEGG